MLPLQVGGHSDALEIHADDPSAIVKATTGEERAFYAEIGRNLGVDFVGKWTPAYYGELKLMGRMGQGGEIVAGSDDKTRISLENIAHPFDKPCILDIKLGTQLYDERTATPEKKAKMELKAAARTSLTTGMSITGGKVWTGDTYVELPRAWGGSLKEADLADALCLFFAPHCVKREVNGLSIPEREHGRERKGGEDTSRVGEPERSEGSRPESRPGSPTRLDSPLRCSEPHSAVLTEVIAELTDLISVMKRLELRIRGGSLLIIYEGNMDLLRAGLANPDDVKIDGDSEYELVPYDFRLIDFAHTRLAPGEGPDEGVIKGLYTLYTLMERVRGSLGEPLRVGLSPNEPIRAGLSPNEPERSEGERGRGDARPSEGEGGYASKAKQCNA